MRADENQRYGLTVTFGYFIGMPVAMLIAALSIFLLCLTSSWAMCIIGSPVFSFLGDISYSLYLLHTFIIEWPMKELQYYWVQDGMNYDAAAYYVFLIFTPILILISWGATLFIDTPSKNLAQKLDLNARKDVPKPAPGRPGVKQVGCFEFSLTNWQVYTIVIYLLAIFIITEGYQSFNGNRERIADSGVKHPKGMQASQ